MLPINNCPVWVKNVSNPESLHVQMELSDNPMYMSEDGHRIISEPTYQVLFRVDDIQDGTRRQTIYEYFDSPSLIEANQYVFQIAESMKVAGIEVSVA